MAVFYVVTERIQPNLAGFESDFRCPPQTTRVVDDAHQLEWRSLGATPGPDAQRVEGGDGICEEGGRPVVRFRRAQADKKGLGASLSESDRGRQAGRPSANHDSGVSIVVGSRDQ